MDFYDKFMDFYHPPLLPMPDIPVCRHYGSYLVKRKHDVHTGVDLYSPEGSNVYAVEKGEIVSIRYFTGKEIGYPYWNTTFCIDIEGNTGTICYGEITPDPIWSVGDKVEMGSVIGKVKTVLKKDKGKAMSMLHFSIHSHGWRYLVKDQEDPNKENYYDLQIDPTLLLIQLKNKAERIKK